MSDQPEQETAPQPPRKSGKKKLLKLLLLWLGPLGFLGVLIAFILVFVLSISILAAVGGGGGGSKANSVSQCMATGDAASGEGRAPSVRIAAGNLGDPVDPEGMVVTSGFEVREIFGGTQMHAGVDFGAAMGSPIYAVADGEVVHSNEDPSGYGHWIGIMHEIDGQQVETLYGHMYSNTVKVQVGDKVKAGEQIAEVGNNGGMTTGPHLHFGVYPGGWQVGDATAVDPLPWLENLGDHNQPSETPDDAHDEVSADGGTSDSDTDEDSSSDSDEDSGDSTSSDEDGASTDEEEDVADDTDMETTMSGNLNRPQQANVAAIISGVRNSDLDDEEQQRRAAEIAVAVAGMQSNFLSVNNQDDPNRVGIFGLAPLGDTTRSDLADPKRASIAFFKKLTDTYKDDDRWMDMPTGDVAAEVYNALTSIKSDVADWDDMAAGAVDKLWDSEEAARGANVDRELVENTEGDPCQATGGETGGELAPGSVPEEFVKWLNLGAKECDALTPALLAAQIYLEGGFQPHEANSAGAMGYTQFIPGTWATYGFRVDDSGKQVGAAGEGDPNNVADAVMAQARLNCENVDTIKGWQDEGKVSKTEDMHRMMFAAYQGGAGSVLEAGGMPNYSDGNMTQTQYADHIIETSKQFGTDDSGDISSTDSGTSGSAVSAEEALRGIDLGGGSVEGRKIVEAASSQVGITYAWGGGDKNGPTQGIRDGGVADMHGDFAKVGYDCSGLTTYAAYQGAKVDIPKGTGAQTADSRLKLVSMSDIRPGDFLYTPGHVSIYAGVDKETGERMIVEAPQSGDTVHVVPLNTPNADARRLDT